MKQISDQLFYRLVELVAEIQREATEKFSEPSKMNVQFFGDVAVLTTRALTTFSTARLNGLSLDELSAKNKLPATIRNSEPPVVTSDGGQSIRFNFITPLK